MSLIISIIRILIFAIIIIAPGVALPSTHTIRFVTCLDPSVISSVSVYASGVISSSYPMPSSHDGYGIYSLEADVSFGYDTTIVINVGEHSSDHSNPVKYGGCDWDRSGPAGVPDGEVGIYDFSLFRNEMALGGAQISEFGSLRDAYGLTGCLD